MSFPVFCPTCMFGLKEPHWCVCVVVPSVTSVGASGENNIFDGITSFKELEQLQCFSFGSVLGMTCEMMALPGEQKLSCFSSLPGPSLLTWSLLLLHRRSSVPSASLQIRFMSLRTTTAAFCSLRPFQMQTLAPGSRRV